MATLYLLCGVPACGKSTFAKKVSKNNDVFWISRDAIRFELIQEDDEYFIHENEVFDIFIRQITHHLQAGQDVMADATHIHRWSRYKTINAVKKYIPNIEISCIWFGDSGNIETLIERNNKREGRAKVPNDVIINMQENFCIPTFDEYEYNAIFEYYNNSIFVWNDDINSYDIFNLFKLKDDN